MNNVSIQSIKARYKELFPLGVDKKEFIENIITNIHIIVHKIM